MEEGGRGGRGGEGRGGGVSRRWREEEDVEGRGRETKGWGPGRGRNNWDENYLMRKENRLDGNKKKSGKE